jgi:siroheme synthase-like protein
VRVDHAAGGTAALMGAVHRGPVVLAVSTSGVAPGLTRLLRLQVEGQFGPEYGHLAMLWGDLRADERVRSTLGALDAQARRTRWRAIYRPDILGLIRAGKLGEAKEAALACLLSSSD